MPLPTTLLSCILFVASFCLAPAVSAGGGSIHQSFSALLAKYVSNGTVNYSQLKSDKGLSEYVQKLTASNPQSLSGNEEKAFWINAYNAFTLQLIIDNWPVKSIRDLEGGKVWDKKWIKIGGLMYSLNQIENDILRPKGDARVHYALVCAAKGCPPLRDEAFLANSLDSQLDEQARQYVRSGPGHSYSTSSMTANVSQLYKWYAKDFGKGAKGLIEHLAKFATSSVAKAMRNNPSAWKIEYVTYDWSINGR